MKTSESRYNQCIYFVSNALARKVEKLAIDVWKQVDLSPSHAYLLMITLQEPGVQPGTLSDELNLKPSTVTRLIEKLEEKKLVVRTNEGKTTNVYPTPKAKSLFPQLQQCSQAFCMEYEAVLGKEESKRLVNGMKHIADKLAD